MSTFNSESMLAIMLKRLNTSQKIDEVVVAIPDTPENDDLEDHLADLDCSIFRGPEEDVLARYWHAAKHYGADIVIRLTADCPLIDSELVDEVVELVSNGETRFAATSEEFPDGLDVEAVRFELLDEAFHKTRDVRDREHVTPYIHRSYSQERILLNPHRRLQPVRLTLDEKVDLAVITGVLEMEGATRLSAYDIDDLARTHPAVFEANRHLDRNEGAQMGSGQKLWRRAEKVIAGGNMLLSKHPKMHLPNEWPIYFSKAKGCRIWDLDGRELLDFGWMGVGTNILGYSHPKVDEAVKKAISAGNMSTLNAPEEVELAERLIELHPWADMARFTRSGGEAGAVAVRIARAATGRARIVFCGYHGWHDWYLAANLGDDRNLDGHLLPGLEPGGVPRGLRGTSTPFAYNDFEGFQKATQGDDVAAIVMEVERSSPPAPGFLEEVRRKASEIGAVLIFDECTSGFRKVLGGHHLTLGIEPDIAIFGKTLGNGYAINAVIGREPVMSAINKTFISSTFWTERIGPVAALSALDEMARSKAPEEINDLGATLRNGLKKSATEAGLELTLTGLPSLTRISIDGLDPIALRNFVSQKLLEKNVLGGLAFYLAVPHSNHIGDFLETMHHVFLDVQSATQSGLVPRTEASAKTNDTFARLN